MIQFVRVGGTVHEKSLGPNYIRFGLTFSTDFQGESSFALPMGHRRVWLNSLGGEWRNGLDLGVPLGNAGELRFGPVYAFYKGTPTVAVPQFSTTRQTDAGARLLARGDFTANLALGLTERSFVSVAAHAGALNRDDPSLVNPILLGGFLNLSGLRNGQLAGSYLGFGRIVYYHHLTMIPLIGGRVHVGGSLEAGNTWQQRDAVSAGDLVKAGSVFLAAGTFIGPFYFAYGRATGGASSFYLYLGRPR